MNLADLSSSPLSMLPALLALGLAIVTRRVLLSLSVGILSGALLLNNYSFSGAFDYTSNVFTGLFYDGEGANTWNLTIIVFLVFLGMITALMTLSGGTIAFARWAQDKVKNKRGSRVLAVFLGVFIFVDDYFNSLAVGAISRPVTDKFGISRAKLAYILDSTAAPMCVIMPMSSWGAYIVTVIGGILVAHGLSDISPLMAFVTMIPMNFYAIFALLLVCCVAWFDVNLGAMKTTESMKSLQASKVDDDENDIGDILDEEMGIESSQHGQVADLLVPIAMLIISTVGWMIFSGSQALSADSQAFSMLGAFENTDVGGSLLVGSSVGLIFALFTVFRQKLPLLQIIRTLWLGTRSMFGAVLILLFAWMIGNVISDMSTGKYLSSLIQGNLPVAVLPFLVFLLSALMAFSTGTSWGTFGIMLPIAGDMAASVDIAIMLPMLAAVLAGAVFGDHCSPISDTTILSSTGARCDHMEHVITQLPYALLTASISSVAFLVLGFTGSVMLAFMVGLAIFGGAMAMFHRNQMGVEARITATR